jgi:hypothetical protein
MKKIDALPAGPKWTCEIIKVHGEILGDQGEELCEEVELWRRDPVECVRQLMGNPAFRDHLVYAPQRVYADKQAQERIYDEMWTGDWWWQTQVCRTKSAESN